MGTGKRWVPASTTDPERCCGKRCKVVETRRVDGGIRRRRQCPACHATWSTLEVRTHDNVRPMDAFDPVI